MTWTLWGALLLAQSAAFTLVSRARNSGSLWYNGVASTLSNGVWFVGQFFVVDTIVRVKASGEFGLLVASGLFYTGVSVAGSVAMQHVLMRHVERGDRRVGA